MCVENDVILNSPLQQIKLEILSDESTADNSMDTSGSITTCHVCLLTELFFVLTMSCSKRNNIDDTVLYHLW